MRCGATPGSNRSVRFTVTGAGAMMLTAARGMPKIPTFDETRNGSQVSFGRTWTAAVLDHSQRLGLRRVAVLCTPGRTDLAERAVSLLGERSVGMLALAKPDTPKDTVSETDRILDELGADGVLTVGGGSATALGKATQLSRSRPFIAVPTTYCGAEMTDSYGEHREEGIVWSRDDRVRPTVVVYDPALTLSLSREQTATSLFAALVLAVDALYSRLTSARLQAMASSAITRIAVNLVRACEEPDNLEVRAAVMRGAYQASTVHGSAGEALALHLCRATQAHLDSSYATIQCALLPHVVAFNASIASRATQAIGRAVGARDPAAALFDLALIVDGPTRLDRHGLTVDLAKEVAAEVSLGRLDNPRRASAVELEALLHDVRLGRRPSTQSVRWPALAADSSPHGTVLPTLGGRAIDRARRIVVLVHGEGNTAERMMITAAPLFESVSAIAFVALQAEGRSWFPHNFDAPIRDNEPAARSAFAQLDAAIVRLEALGFERDKIVLCGEAQGATVVLDYAARRGGDFAGVIGFGGALLGPLRSGVHHDGMLRGVPILLGGREGDPWVSKTRVTATSEVLAALSAKPRVIWYETTRPELDNRVTDAVREMFGKGPRGDRGGGIERIR